MCPDGSQIGSVKITTKLKYKNNENAIAETSHLLRRNGGFPRGWDQLVNLPLAVRDIVAHAGELCPEERGHRLRVLVEFHVKSKRTRVVWAVTA